jgi:hypothetical protein
MPKTNHGLPHVPPSNTNGDYVLINEKEAYLSKLDFAYIIGLFLAEGSFQVHFKKDLTTFCKYNIVATFNITQSVRYDKNIAFMVILKSSLESFAVKSTITSVDQTNQRLNIAGNANFEKFKTALRNNYILKIDNCPINCFVNLRYRDFLILDTIEDLIANNAINTHLGFLLAIRLRYNLHCYSKNEKLQTVSNRLSLDDAIVKYSQLVYIDYANL